MKHPPVKFPDQTISRDFVSVSTNKQTQTIMDIRRHMEYKDNFHKLQTLLNNLEGLHPNDSIDALTANVERCRSLTPHTVLHRYVSLLHGLRAYLAYKDGCELLKSMLGNFGPEIVARCISFESMSAVVDGLLLDHRVDTRHINCVYGMLLAYRSATDAEVSLR